MRLEVSPPIAGWAGEVLLGILEHLWFQMRIGRVCLKERFPEAQLVQSHRHHRPALFPYPDTLHRLLVKPWMCVRILPHRLKPVAVAVVRPIQSVQKIADRREIGRPGTGAHADCHRDLHFDPSALLEGSSTIPFGYPQSLALPAIFHEHLHRKWLAMPGIHGDDFLVL